MDTNVNGISEIVAGKINRKLKVRVINVWTVPNRNSPNEINTLEMILIDNKCARIQAVIKRQWFQRFFHKIQLGSAYLLERGLVAQNDVAFKKTTHKFKLNFMGTTVLTSIMADDIPVTVFEFCDFPTILRETRTDIFADVIGYVVEKSNIQEKIVNGKDTLLLDIILEDLSQHRVKCTLWGDFAQQMQAHLENLSPSEPLIVVIQMCRLTKYLGVMGVSSAFFGSRLYVNEDILQIQDYKSRMDMISDTLTHLVTQTYTPAKLKIAEEILQTPRKTISELIEATEVCVGSVLARIIEIDIEQGFAFNSCNTCYGAATRDGSKFRCCHCDCLVSASPRYKLQVNVIDDTGSATFTMFNQLVTKVIGKTVTNLIKALEQRSNAPEVPIEFQELIGNQYVFKVQVSDMNIRRGFQAYTVKKLSSEATVIQDFINKHGIHVSNEEDEAVFTSSVVTLANTSPIVKEIINLGDPDPSENVGVAFTDLMETPTSKSKGKRPMSDIDYIDLNNMDFSPASVNKVSKGVLKIEDKE